MNKDELYRVHMEWIERCLAADKLTEWEQDFVTSVKAYLERKGSLSSRQAEILEKIYAEKTD